MKHRVLIIITALWWLGLTAWIVNYNFAPFGSISLHWNNPTRPTSAFAWQTQPMVSAGHVVVAAQSSQRFSITLPRGFVTGTLVLATTQPADFLIAADAQANQTVSSQTNNAAIGQLKITWAQLQAHGRTFGFQVKNLGIQPLAIKTVTLTVQR